MSIWWGRRPRGPIVDVLGFGDDAQPDGAVIDLDADPSAPVLMRAEVEAGTQRVLALHVGDWLPREAPALWYVEYPETAARPPAMALVAFATPHRAPGTVVDAPTFTEMPVRSDEQAGAVRWYPATGLLHQIYVSPALRRRGVGSKLLAAAGAYRAAKGWAPIWGNGERTDLGEVFIRDLPSPFQARITARSRVVPPMTPADAAAGLDRRLLEPDPTPR